MAEAISISTNKYKKQGKVEIDGHTWDIKLPGAGTELKLSQAQRRIKLLAKKDEEGTATEADLDKYDHYEEMIYKMFQEMFQDGTKDNSEVKKWLDETPLSFVYMAFEEIKKQSAEGEGESDGSETPTASQ